MVVVDNYQGEENKIIILSLVRSNGDNKIGFLSIKNRVCVALSRAKYGFFMIGNMSCLCNGSDIWKKINATLQGHNAVGKL
jgi:superfamily I DNA and/or RNA helicase